jgi:hypothetical protein
MTERQTKFNNLYNKIKKDYEIINEQKHKSSKSHACFEDLK